MGSTVDQDELPAGYTVIESTHVILGVGTVKTIAMKGGTHPKMRLLMKDINTVYAAGDGPTGAYSFAYPIIDTTGGAVFEVLHKDLRLAGQTVAQVTLHCACPFAPVAKSATLDVDPVFEANEDVILQPSTANGSAADTAIIVLKFEVVN